MGGGLERAEGSCGVGGAPFYRSQDRAGPSGPRGDPASSASPRGPFARSGLAKAGCGVRRRRRAFLCDLDPLPERHYAVRDRGLQLEPRMACPGWLGGSDGPVDRAVPLEGSIFAALSAAAFSTSLCIDALFDVTTAAQGAPLVTAVLEAVLVELPFAALAFILAIKILSSKMASAGWPPA